MVIRESGERALVADHVSVVFGGVTALSDVSIRVEPGATVGVIGPNGAGKTSLLNCLNGFYRASSGSVRFGESDISRTAPHKVAGLGISRTFQAMELVLEATVLQNIMLGRHIHMRRGLFAGMLYFGPARREEIRHREAVEEVIEFLEIQRLRDREVSTLSAGQQKLIGLARALASEPEVLLLDEPSAGMNREERSDIARFLQRIRYERPTSQVLIEHDVRFVRDICDYIYVLDFGTVIAEGTPDEVLQNEAVIAAYTGTTA